MLRPHLQKHGTIHLLWTVVILLLVICGLLITMPNGITLYNYISFAAAIASILLATTGIFHAIISNQAFAESVGTLKNSSDRISEDSHTLSESVGSLFSEVDKISKIVDLVPASVKSMSDALSSKIDSMSSRDPAIDNTTKTDDSNGRPWFNMLPIGALIGFYCAYKSYITNRDFDPEDIGFEHQYVQGMVFGALSIVSALSPCKLNLNRVGSSYQCESLGEYSKDELSTLLDDDNEFQRENKKLVDDYFDSRSN